MDIRFPEHVSELIAKELIEWRELSQQREMAMAVEKVAGRAATATSITEELARLKELLDKEVVTKEEFKRTKKLLGE